MAAIARAGISMARGYVLTALTIVFTCWCVLDANAAAAQSATGNWRSTVTDGNEGTWTLQASRADDGSFTGTLTATGPSDFAQGSAYGSLTPTGELQFGVVYNDVEEAAFVGTVCGGVVSGTYTTTKGDAGTWIGSLVNPLSP